jgi:hypothetical protein
MEVSASSVNRENFKMKLGMLEAHIVADSQLPG